MRTTYIHSVQKCYPTAWEGNLLGDRWGKWEGTVGGGYDQHILHVCIKWPKNKKKLEMGVYILVCL